MSSKKTLVISAICFPPCLIGPACLMDNLFRHFPKGSYHILMGRLDHQWLPLDMESMLPAQYTYTRWPNFALRGNLFQCIRAFMRNVYAILEVSWKGLMIIRREKIDSIFVVSDHYFELSALFMSWLTGKKVVMWLPDLYYVPEVNYAERERILRRFLEPFLLRRMSKTLVTAEVTQEYYKEKYNLDTEVLPHTTNIQNYNKPKLKLFQRKETTMIMYTGGFTNAQQCAIMDLVNLINKFPDLKIKFTLCSIEPPDLVEKMGLSPGSNVVIRQANREEIPALQQSADILFLPFSFPDHGYSYHSILRTASPSKLPEYLVAGRPILVYAPAYTYYSRYARQEGFGLVVDQPDPDLLREALIKLQSDQSLCVELAENARRVAKEFHDSEKISRKLQTILGTT